jgi:hypothetical protein
MARRRSTHCKRGHERVAGEKACKACLRMRYRAKYARDEAFRKRKRAQVNEWRRKFVDANGFWPDALYDRKPKRLKTPGLSVGENSSANDWNDCSQPRASVHTDTGTKASAIGVPNDPARPQP